MITSAITSMTSFFPVRALHMFLFTCSLATAPAHAADPGKTLHLAFPVAETSFDPAFASDGASDGIIANTMESMLDCDYLARPVNLVPRTLEAMPAVEENGKTYTMKVRTGIFFTPDPVFRSKPRELTAADHAYGLKRILDPASIARAGDAHLHAPVSGSPHRY